MSLPHGSSYHVPVLCEASVDWLVTDPAGVYVDCTLGGGGHSEAILQRLQAGGVLVGIDQDEQALSAATERLAGSEGAGRFVAVKANFGEIGEVLRRLEFTEVAGVIADLGVSSFQIDSPERGFSYMAAGPLDMRMDSAAPLSAADIVNGWGEEELARALWEYGEERGSRRIAARIVNNRPITSTAQLATIVKSSVPFKQQIKTLSRVFQGLRIAVNGEMKVLDSLLNTASKLVRSDGRLVVLSYHSLEDRRVKRVMKTGNLEGTLHKDMMGNPLSQWKPLTRKPVVADEEEVALNPRARSARLRVAERTAYSARTPQT